MKRSEIVCVKCIKFEVGQCCLYPKRLAIGSVDSPDIINANPEIHWCSNGVWHEWSERYKETEPFYWGEGEDEDKR